MATFVTTVKFTPQGMKGISKTTQRAEALKSTAKELGIDVTDVYWTLGDYDGVLIFRAPDDGAAAGFLLKLSAAGNVQTTATRAFTAEEMDQILTNV